MQALYHREATLTGTTAAELDISELTKLGINAFVTRLTQKDAKAVKKIVERKNGQPANPAAADNEGGMRVKVLSRRAKKRLAASKARSSATAASGTSGWGLAFTGNIGAPWALSAIRDTVTRIKNETIAATSAISSNSSRMVHRRAPPVKPTARTVKKYAKSGGFKNTVRAPKYTDLGKQRHLCAVTPMTLDDGEHEEKAAVSGRDEIISETTTEVTDQSNDAQNEATAVGPDDAPAAALKEDKNNSDDNNSDASVTTAQVMAQPRASWRKKTHQQKRATSRAASLQKAGRKRLTQQYGRVRSQGSAKGKPKEMVESRKQRAGTQHSMFQYYPPAGSEDPTTTESPSLSPMHDPSCDYSRSVVSSLFSSSGELMYAGGKSPIEAPILLADWMECFRLHIVDVPANGHCFYGAYFAATAGYCDVTSLEYVNEVRREVQTCRDRILYIAVDQVKVETGLGHRYQAEQRTLVRELYPEEGWNADSEVNAVADRLVKHCEETEDVRIGTTVSQQQWARAAEIGAAAVALREPLYVLDVLVDGTILA